jgi:hypothetical protein
MWPYVTNLHRNIQRSTHLEQNTHLSLLHSPARLSSVISSTHSWKIGSTSIISGKQSLRASL